MSSPHEPPPLAGLSDPAEEVLLQEQPLFVQRAATPVQIPASQPEASSVTSRNSHQDEPPRESQ